MGLGKKTVEELAVKGKRVLVRCDFNVPMKEGVITNDNRIVAALPTIQKLIDNGAKVILCSHLGKPKNGPEEKFSLAPVAVRLSELLGKPVVFANDDEVVGANAKAAVAAMQDGDVVLGLNDALVELTGSLAGFAFALQNTRLIALSGLIVGISATFSMASSEFLAARSEGRSDALKSCSYTGIAYLLTVVALIAPYLLFPTTQFIPALLCMLVVVILIIAGFTYYTSVAQDQPFKSRFLEMAVISVSVAVLSFVVGILAKRFLGVDL